MFGFLSSLFVFTTAYILALTSIRSSRILFTNLITSVINAPIPLFHDIRPKGQILNRLSKDIGMIDSNLSQTFRSNCVNFYVFMGVMIVCSIYMYYSLFYLPILLISGIYLVRFYMHASRDLKRIVSSVRSPILNIR